MGHFHGLISWMVSLGIPLFLLVCIVVDGDPSTFQALEMIHNIREAFNEILVGSDWMDEETKAVAKEKVRTSHNWT